MVFGLQAPLTRPLHLYPWVCISLMLGTSHVLPDKPCTMKLKMQDFQFILSWELKNRSVVPTHYTLWYTVMSKPVAMKMVEDCTNITRSYCDVTDWWKNLHDTYFPKVVGFTENTVPISCVDSFSLAVNITLEPPDFDIFGSANHINVVVQFPPPGPRRVDVGKLRHYLSLVVEQRSGEMVKKHKPKINQNTGDFIYVMDKLIPSTNYCVSVYFEPKSLAPVTRSPLKCTVLPDQEPAEPSESAKIGGIITVFLIAAVFISSLLVLKRVGYICLTKYLPDALKFYNKQASMFLEVPPLEAVDPVEVIHVERKKKVWDYSYGDESDSEDEATPRASAGGYTRHGLIPLPPVQAPAPWSTSEDSLFREPEVEDPDQPEAEVEPLLIPAPSSGQSEHASAPSKGRDSGCQDPFSEEDSSSIEDSGGGAIFHVNLNSVCVRALDDDDDGDVSLVLPDETVDLEDPEDVESSFLIPGEAGMLPPFPSPSEECPGSEDALSGKSDTSESDTDTRDGYIMRQC